MSQTSLEINKSNFIYTDELPDGVMIGMDNGSIIVGTGLEEISNMIRTKSVEEVSNDDELLHALLKEVVIRSKFDPEAAELIREIKEFATNEIKKTEKSAQLQLNA